MALEKIVQDQVIAYNSRDIEKFAACYAEDIQIFALPLVQPTLVGKKAFTDLYTPMFEKSVNLHAKILSRQVHGSFVVDEEQVSGIHSRSEPVRCCAIYQVVNGLIQNVWFVG